jgi:hypothetical protein
VGGIIELPLQFLGDFQRQGRQGGPKGRILVLVCDANVLQLIGIEIRIENCLP